MVQKEVLLKIKELATLLGEVIDVDEVHDDRSVTLYRLHSKEYEMLQRLLCACENLDV